MSLLGFAQMFAAEGRIYVVKNGSFTALTLKQYAQLGACYPGAFQGYLVAVTREQAQRLAKRQQDEVAS